MSILEPIRISFIKRKIELAKRNGWRHAIFNPADKLLVKGYYKGEWRNDKKEGKGSQLNRYNNYRNHRNGFVYEGDWFNGKRHGYGTLSKIYGQLDAGIIRKCYIGQWENGKKHGFGYNWYEDNSYYEGNFCQNKRQGYGRIWYCNGDYYEGCWKNDLYDGMGIFVKFNGNRYEGEFVTGKKEGLGTFYHIVTGQKQYGAWKDDSFINGTMSDMHWRQSAFEPTPYPIPRLKLIADDAIKYTHETYDDNNEEEKLSSCTCKRPLKRVFTDMRSQLKSIL
ncbi:uncharacterized protein LOC116428866 [Nomia melanderi]|uniref:uncharacterized protein LOC116428866 n=1 Tax=Nomia melanderi TaxID=2448451 RepID=UPI001303FB46|nr:MORN repeat-containing protein 3-like [Nomia melanderi]